MSASTSRNKPVSAAAEGNHKVFIADARSMQEVGDNSVHLVVTSPPYWQLKDYDTPSQLGFSDTYERYINHLNLVWSECERVLHPGCRLCVNIGDQFARSAYYSRYKVIPIRTEIIRFCETLGFDYMGAVVWQKVTTTNTTGGGTVMGSFPFPRNGVIRLDYEFILLFRKHGTAPTPDRLAREDSRLTNEEWKTYFSGHWNFPGERQCDHLAMFPEELPRRLIRMFSFVGDTVLDPFLGSGTTSLAALRNDRHSIGYEINPQFRRVIENKLGREAAVSAPRRQRADYEEAIGQLPYLFHDPVPIDRKIDPRLRTYGSKIDSHKTEKRTLSTVVDVPSSDAVVLDSGRKVCLLGDTCNQEQTP